MAILAERESHAAYFLHEQDMSRYDAVNCINQQGVVRQSFSHDRTKPVAIEKIKRRTAPRDGKAGRNTR